MNPLIDLLDQALQANLSKRQWAAFAVVLRQTLGFRKTEDDLAPRRLEQLSGIRRNHIWQAKKELEAIGLLESRAGRYGEILSFPRLRADNVLPVQCVKTAETAARSATNSPPNYPSLTIEPDVEAPETCNHGGQPEQKNSQNTATEVATNTAEPSPPIPPPLTPETGQTHPKTGQTYARIGTKPGPKQDTTRNNLTIKNHNTVGSGVSDNGLSATATESAALHYPSELSATERQQAPTSLDGLSPQAAQQVLDVWACKIGNGEVRKSRLGLLNALVKAQRRGALDTRCLGSRHPASPAPDDPVLQEQKQAREHWLEQQAQQAWLRDMQRLGVPVEHLKPPVYCSSGGVL